MEERGGERKSKRERETESKRGREHNSLGELLASFGLIIRDLRRAFLRITFPPSNGPNGDSGSVLLIFFKPSSQFDGHSQCFCARLGKR